MFQKYEDVAIKKLETMQNYIKKKCMISIKQCISSLN